MDIDDLREQHDELADIAGQLLDIVAQDQPQKVGALRWRLARMLILHLSVEDRFLYPAMIATKGDAQEVAEAFREEMGGLAREFTNYMSRWTDRDIAEQWPRFQQETRMLLTMLASRIHRENSELYPLAPDGWQGKNGRLDSAA